MWYNYPDNYYGDELYSEELPKFTIKTDDRAPMGFIGFYKLREKKKIRVKAGSYRT